MFGNLSKLMKMAGEMKARMPEMQEKLAVSEYAAAAGGGAVSATVNGKLELVDVTIDPDALGDLDAEILGDLLKAAVAAAQAKASEAAAEAMRELTGGMDLPGLDGLMGPQ